MGSAPQVARVLQEIQVGANIPLPIYLATFVVGYFALLIAYQMRGRLDDWRKLNFFDKTIETFFVGGCITVSTILIFSFAGVRGLLVYETFSEFLPAIILFDMYSMVFFGAVIGKFFISPKKRRRVRRRS